MTATLLLAAALVQPLDAVKLDLKPGTKLVYTTTVSVNGEGMGQTFTSTTKLKETVEVTELKDGWMALKRSTDEYKLETDSEFASMAPDVKGMVVTGLVSPQRKMKDWKIAANGGLTPEQAEIVASGSKAEMEVGLEGLVFPEGELAVGTKWENEHLPAGGGFGGMRSTPKGKVKTLYEVTAIKDGVATIKAVTNGSYGMEIDAGGQVIDLQVKSDETKTFTVRLADGVVTKVEGAGAQTIGSDFGEFSSNTKTLIELAK